MIRHSLALSTAALLLLHAGAAAQNVPAPAQDATCTALRAEVAQIERDMRTESTAMTRSAEDMRKKMMGRAKKARGMGLLSSVAGMIPGVGMAASMGTSLLSSAASAGGGGGMGMPKEMEEAMARQNALSDRMVAASAALSEKCGEHYATPPMSPEELKALQAATPN
ncbi:hypothetical protein P6144_04700 [Sphingomonas sp. HITSZ_GF]|uniref:hypothetical protein n=1 Tax=Sphingomonas sp. HITSZ_GF TaxID=3037247 RepID=UPI00240CF771|nr:hypothetical protein [Sphingomonas sp. HITSZ_GF]MDG2532935.1 hypothetical protein [Sphingomonas sp. HITSZ_GF]